MEYTAECESLGVKQYSSNSWTIIISDVLSKYLILMVVLKPSNFGSLFGDIIETNLFCIHWECFLKYFCILCGTLSKYILSEGFILYYEEVK